MIDDLRALGIFAETIKQGSFKAAANILNLSPSVVSYQITQLEKRLGVALIYRSTRCLSLTSQGETLFHHAMTMLDAASKGIHDITLDRESLVGSLSISLPGALIKSPITDKIAEFSQRHPLLTLNLCYTDERQNLIEKGIDLAFRAGNMDDCNLKATKIGDIKRKLVCSLDYFKTIKAPTDPSDVEQLHWIKLDMLPNHRTLINSDGLEITVNMNARINVNSVEAMTQLCKQGLGLATPPDYLVNQALEEETLIEVMSAWQVKPIPLYAVWPNNVFQSSNTKRLINYLKSVPKVL